MNTDPEKATIADLFRLMTDQSKRLTSIEDRLSNIEAEMKSTRLRMQHVEQSSVAVIEQIAGVNKRFDDSAERMDRLEKRLTFLAPC